MTTLEAIGLTLGVGSSLGAACFVLFGAAVRLRTPIIAPRCTARSKDTIYNPYPHHASQDRGSAMFGWIPWILRLSYDTMLRGVPGTGTRKNGLGGKNLSVTLDAVMMLRFHAICLKVALLTTFLSIGLVLPLNLTANCYSNDLGLLNITTCIDPNEQNRTLTNYERTTIANIPPLVRGSNVQDLNFSLDMFYNAIWWGSAYSDILGRLYTIVFCSWVVYWYGCLLLKQEWGDAIALRRVYYLENEVWGRRKRELMELKESEGEEDGSDGELQQEDESDERQTLLKDSNGSNGHVEEAKQPASEQTLPVTEVSTGMQAVRGSNGGGRRRKKNAAQRRPPWIPDPEYRETVPNIELYSVLVGDIPDMPFEAADIEQAIGYNPAQDIEWEMALVSTFFDQCVTSPPGFSSSVAAVTILPNAPDMALAWRKWYGAAAALRRLKFIRTLIADRRMEEQEGGEGWLQEDEEVYLEDREVTNGASLGSGFLTVTASPVAQDGNNNQQQQQHQEQANPMEHADQAGKDTKRTMSLIPEGQDDDDNDNDNDNDNDDDDDTYTTADEKFSSRHMFGMSCNLEVEQQLFSALNYGPEQISIYTREMAQGASNCCPNGCCEGRLRKSPMEELIKLEEETLLRVFDAHQDLREARERAAEHVAPAKVPPSSTQVERGNYASGASSLFSSELESDFLRESDRTSSLSVAPQRTLFQSFKMEEGGAEESEGWTDRKKPSTVALSHQDQDAKIKSKALPPRSHEANQNWDDLKQLCSPPQRLTSSDPAQLRANHLSSSKSLYSSLRNIATDGGGLRATLNSEGRFVLKESDGNLEMPISRIDTAASTEYGTPQSSGSPVDAKITRRKPLERTVSLPEDRNKLLSPESSDRWRKVEQIRRERASRQLNSSESFNLPEHVSTGVWNFPSVEDAKTMTGPLLARKVLSVLDMFRRWLVKKIRKVTRCVQRNPRFAVVTFTSRQAAVAVRQCLSDGRGEGRWLTVQSIPVPPLADAAPCDFVTCRGCCRPVTLGLNRNQQLARKICAFSLLAFIYIFWTVPFTLVASVSNVHNLEKVFPKLMEHPELVKSLTVLTGLVPGLLQTLFVSLSPMVFRTIANSGSNSVSLAEADASALQYYWWFMVVTAFSGTSIASMVLSGITNGTNGIRFNTLLLDIAKTVPTQVSSVWTNWLIIRATTNIPSQYMLQINAFIFGFLGWNCCKRADQGGGPGADIPYRLYVDSGVIFMCVVALSFASPLVAPFGAFCLLICIPILRRNCVYVYRPKYDGGGFRWPFLFDVCISSMVMGQVLLATIVFLKKALGPAILALAPVIPTLIFSNKCKRRFGRSFEESGLLQASLLDNFGATSGRTADEREEFRRFLVDAHKAAYIPVCLAGDVTNVLTDEPAEVVPLPEEIS